MDRIILDLRRGASAPIAPSSPPYHRSSPARPVAGQRAEVRS